MLASIIRTVVPVIVGAILGYGTAIGLSLPEGAVTEIVTVAITGAYYGFARWVESVWPSVGRFLLSLGLTRKQPTYESA